MEIVGIEGTRKVKKCEAHAVPHGKRFKQGSNCEIYLRTDIVEGQGWAVNVNRGITLQYGAWINQLVTIVNADGEPEYEDALPEGAERVRFGELEREDIFNVEGESQYCVMRGDGGYCCITDGKFKYSSDVNVAPDTPCIRYNNATLLLGGKP